MSTNGIICEIEPIFFLQFSLNPQREDVGVIKVKEVNFQHLPPIFDSVSTNGKININYCVSTLRAPHFQIMCCTKPICYRKLQYPSLYFILLGMITCTRSTCGLPTETGIPNRRSSTGRTYPRVALTLYILSIPSIPELLTSSISNSYKFALTSSIILHKWQS